MIPKERALPDFLDMTYKSASWQNLTQLERWAFTEEVLYHTRSRLFGDYNQRFKILNAIYDSYLIGLGKFNRVCN